MIYLFIVDVLYLECDFEKKLNEREREKSSEILNHVLFQHALL